MYPEVCLGRTVLIYLVYVIYALNIDWYDERSCDLSTHHLSKTNCCTNEELELMMFVIKNSTGIKSTFLHGSLEYYVTLKNCS